MCIGNMEQCVEPIRVREDEENWTMAKSEQENEADLRVSVNRRGGSGAVGSRSWSLE
jgi:hypothetical protein